MLTTGSMVRRYVFISHSLPVVAEIATRIVVMRAGKFLEFGPAGEILHEPSQAYTRELLATVPALPAQRRKSFQYKQFRRYNAATEISVLGRA
jgi:ABC-type dipeptide/oligopeptide/nickel transport system ATPase component